MASRAVTHIKSSVIFPVLPVVAQAIFLLWFLVVGVYLASAAKPTYRVSLDNCDKKTCTTPDGETLKMYDECHPEEFNCTNCAKASCLFFRYASSWNVIIAHFYNVFGMLWTVLFARAFLELVLAGAFVTWYFVLDKKHDMPQFILFRSFFRSLRYHTGTAAFGSFILAVIKVIRMIFEYIDRKLKEYNQDNPLVKVMMTLCKCCLWCFEK